MVLSLLILVMCFVTLLENNYNKKVIFLIFSIEKVFCQLVFVIFDQYIFRLTGSYYYIPMAIFDFIVIATLSNLIFTPKVVIMLQRICLISIFANLIAWTCWEFYVAHAEVYDLFYLLLYGISIILMIKKENKDGRYLKLDIWAMCLRFNNN